MAFLLGIDAGTGSVKAGLFDTAGGKWLGFSGRPVATRRAGNRAEQDAADCWSAARAAIVELRDRHPAAVARIAAVAVTGQMRGLILVDREGVPLTPALTLHDRRAGSEAEEFIREFRLETIHRATGQRVDAGSAAARLRWLHRHERRLLDRAAAILSHKDYLRLRLTGCAATDATDAAGWLLYDLAAGRWHRDLCRFSGVDSSRLPPIRAAGAIAGTLQPRVAADLGLPPDAVVVVGAGDDIAATGCGAVEPGDVFEHIGSTGSFFAVRGQPVFDSRMVLECYPTERPGVYWAGGSCDGAGTAIRAALSELAGEEPNAECGVPATAGKLHAECWDSVAHILAGWDRKPPGARPIYLPFMGAERCPLWCGDLHSAWLGRRREHGPEQLTLAAHEGVACLLAWILEELARIGVKPKVVHSAGRGGEDPAYGELRATLYRCPVRRADAPDAAVFAAVLIAATAIGEINTIADGVRRWSRTRWLAEPRTDLAAALRDRLRAFQRETRRMMEA